MTIWPPSTASRTRRADPGSLEQRARSGPGKPRRRLGRESRDRPAPGAHRKTRVPGSAATIPAWRTSSGPHEADGRSGRRRAKAIRQARLAPAPTNARAARDAASQRYGAPSGLVPPGRRTARRVLSGQSTAPDRGLEALRVATRRGRAPGGPSREHSSSAPEGRGSARAAPTSATASRSGAQAPRAARRHDRHMRREHAEPHPALAGEGPARRGDSEHKRRGAKPAFRREGAGAAGRSRSRHAAGSVSGSSGPARPRQRFLRDDIDERRESTRRDGRSARRDDDKADALGIVEVPSPARGEAVGNGSTRPRGPSARRESERHQVTDDARTARARHSGLVGCARPRAQPRPRRGAARVRDKASWTRAEARESTGFREPDANRSAAASSSALPGR